MKATIPHLYASMIALLFAANLHAQKLPAYKPSTPFADYADAMNEYYKIVGQKGHNYKHWKRQEWYFSTRLDESGRIPDIQDLKQAALKKAEIQKQNLASNPETINAFTASWSFLGPYIVTSSDNGMGRVNRLGFLPSNPNLIFAATAGGGLWKTTNAGSSWSPLTDGLPNMNLSGVEVDKLNPNIIYILTGDGDGTSGGAAGMGLGKTSTGVLKSTDGGITWNKTGLQWNITDDIDAYCLIMNPSSFSTLLVGCSEGIFRTTNSGSSWTQVLSNEFVWDIQYMPNNPLVVYAGAQGGKFFRSDDGGLTWTKTYDNANAFANRMTIGVTGDNSSVVYMLISNSEEKDEDSAYCFNGLYFSSDQGLHWVKKSSKSPNVFSGDGTAIFKSQESYDHAMAIGPFNDQIVTTGGVRIFKSTNGGTTMNFINNTGLADYHVDIHELVYNPNGDLLYAATDGGVYISADNGTTWVSKNTNLAITQYYRLSVSTASDLYTLAGAQDNGSHLRNSSSTTFERVVGADGLDNAISLSNPAVMFAASQNGNFYRSSNSGNSFSFLVNDSVLSSDYGLVSSPAWLTPIEVSSTSPNEIYLGYFPLVKGIMGVVWDFNGIGYAGFQQPRVSGRTFVRVAPGNTKKIYSADNNYDFDNQTNGRFIWRTFTGGSTWTRIEPSITGSPTFTDLTMNPDDPDEIWVTYGGFIDGQKVYRSLDSGEHWTNVSGSLPNVPINCIIYDDNNGSPNDALYIGTDIGVFYRDNTLGDWIPFSNGLPVVEVTDLEILEASGLLRASTYGRGIWQTALYSSVCVSNATYTTNAHPPSEPFFAAVSNSITSTAVIKGFGANIQYKAGQRVTLNPGFRIDGNTGARFQAYLGPCPGAGVPPVIYGPTFNGLTGYLKE